MLWLLRQIIKQKRRTIMSVDNKIIVAGIQRPNQKNPLYYGWVAPDPFDCREPGYEEEYFSPVLFTRRADVESDKLDEVLIGAEDLQTEYGPKLYVGRMVRSLGQISVICANNYQDLLEQDAIAYSRHWKNIGMGTPEFCLTPSVYEGYKLSSGVVVADDINPSI